MLRTWPSTTNTAFHYDDTIRHLRLWIPLSTRRGAVLPAFAISGSSFFTQLASHRWALILCSSDSQGPPKRCELCLRITFCRPASHQQSVCSALPWQVFRSVQGPLTNLSDLSTHNFLLSTSFCGLRRSLIDDAYHPIGGGGGRWA